MEELIKLDSYPVRGLVRRLLQDKTTRKNIMFASDSYAGYGAEYRDDSQMTENALLGFNSCDIQPRAFKAQSEQNARTRKKAEVFTPAWVVNMMNNHCDAEWFGRDDVFNHQDGQSWEITPEKIIFPKGKSWKAYVDSRRLEITCGESPYIVSRCDSSTGEFIPLERRVGMLDRKMRIVNENTADEAEWFKWALRAFQSVYGYEYQGDNLLIARINLLYTFCDNLLAKWHRQATRKELEKFLNVICWNFWQMDGLTDTPPYGIPDDTYVQLSMFEEETAESETVYCKIYDWRADVSKLFKDNKRGRKNMKFDFLIGNPPYQETSTGEKPADESVYNYFMDSAYEISDKVELITPARFLFNAGNTPTAWNKKMLNDKHLKVLLYQADASNLFKNVDIKGGIAITYRDKNKNFGAIEIFTSYDSLRTILHKVKSQKGKSLMDIVFSQNKFDLEALFNEYPHFKNLISSNGKEKRLTSGCFEKLNCFNEQVKDGYIKILGLIKNKRVYRYINPEYIESKHENLNKYKVIISSNSGSGKFGETLSVPLIGEPFVGFTQSFISFGAFEKREEAEACLKYLKTKFARTMLGILKVTQNGKKPVWKYVPLQNFTENSDIDWSRSIAEIDEQLYKKYGLTAEEIDFIESHVKEMT